MNECQYIVAYKIATFCCKFCQVHFCQILFKLVFISYGYHESPRGEWFFLKHSVYCFDVLCLYYLHTRTVDAIDDDSALCTVIQQFLVAYESSKLS